MLFFNISVMFMLSAVAQETYFILDEPQYSNISEELVKNNISDFNIFRGYISTEIKKDRLVYYKYPKTIIINIQNRSIRNILPEYPRISRKILTVLFLNDYFRSELERKNLKLVSIIIGKRTTKYSVYIDEGRKPEDDMVYVLYNSIKDRSYLICKAKNMEYSLLIIISRYDSLECTHIFKISKINIEILSDGYGPYRFLPCTEEKMESVIEYAYGIYVLKIPKNNVKNLNFIDTAEMSLYEWYKYRVYKIYRYLIYNEPQNLFVGLIIFTIFAISVFFIIKI